MNKVPLTVPPRGSVAIVTGGAHGIGRACCGAFAAVGAHVVVADVDAGDAGAAARSSASTRSTCS